MEKFLPEPVRVGGDSYSLLQVNTDGNLEVGPVAEMIKLHQLPQIGEAELHQLLKGTVRGVTQAYIANSINSGQLTGLFTELMKTDDTPTHDRIVRAFHGLGQGAVEQVFGGLSIAVKWELGCPDIHEGWTDPRTMASYIKTVLQQFTSTVVATARQRRTSGPHEVLDDTDCLARDGAFSILGFLAEYEDRESGYAEAVWREMVKRGGGIFEMSAGIIPALQRLEKMGCEEAETLLQFVPERFFDTDDTDETDRENSWE